jgi:hypothetical protein
MYFSCIESTPGLAIHPRIQWVPGAVSPRVKRQEREADHSPPPSAEVKNDGAILPPRLTSLLRSA